jgi:glycosyltransferase involved in cell wall biosynthesis
MTERDRHLLSVISVAFNEAHHVGLLKKALEELHLPDGIEVESILVDGGSADGTADAAREAGFDQVIERPNASIPVCRNAGIEAARGNWLAFLDADCLPQPDWLEKASPWLNTPEAVIIGWPVEPPAAERTWVENAWYVHWSRKNAATPSPDGSVRKDAFRLITTRNMLLTRQANDQLQGFDENLPTGEDTDYVFRAYTSGIKVLGVPSLRVIHLGEPKTLRAFFRQQLWHANRSSYAKIAEATGARIGGHAPLYTVAFLVSAVMLIAALTAFLILKNPLWLIGMTPFTAVVAGPAFLIARRAGHPLLFLQLLPIYAAYGTARSMDLLGIGRDKVSWKSR